MILRSSLVHLILALWASVSLAYAAAPTSFCKCTCGSNSTIIPLGGELSGAPSVPHSPALQARHPFSTKEETLGSDEEEGNTKKQSGGNCNDCNRQFCLDYNLPFCKGAKEEDVFTTCFQRDSRKDETVVFIFIFATATLLLYAVARPWVEKWVESARERRSYIPVPDQAEQ